MGEAMTLEQALAYLKPAETNNGTISLQAQKAREAVKVIASEIAALQSRAFEDGARPHVAEALKREAQSQDYRRDLAERCYASLKERLLKAAHKAFAGDDRALRRLVHAIENPNPLRGSDALPLQPEGERSDG